MDTSRARELFQKYGAAVAYVEVESTTGERGLGSAFHVGEGVFVTARHVVDGRRIVAVGTTETAYIPLVGTEAEQARAFLHSTEHPVHIVRNEQLEIEVGPFFHKDPLVDIAVFRVANIDARTPVLPWATTSTIGLGRAISSSRKQSYLGILRSHLPAVLTWWELGRRSMR
jgi:S1-C subfamily serine protease